MIDSSEHAGWAFGFSFFRAVAAGIVYDLATMPTTAAVLALGSWISLIVAVGIAAGKVG